MSLSLKQQLKGYSFLELVFSMLFIYTVIVMIFALLAKLRFSINDNQSICDGLKASFLALSILERDISQAGYIGPRSKDPFYTRVDKCSGTQDTEFSKHILVRSFSRNSTQDCLSQLGLDKNITLKSDVLVIYNVPLRVITTDAINIKPINYRYGYAILGDSRQSVRYQLSKFNRSSKLPKNTQLIISQTLIYYLQLDTNGNISLYYKTTNLPGGGYPLVIGLSTCFFRFIDSSGNIKSGFSVDNWSDIQVVELEFGEEYPLKRRVKLVNSLSVAA